MRELRKIQGFRKWGGDAVDAGKVEPAWDAGMAPQRKGEGGSLVVLLLAERAR